MVGTPAPSAPAPAAPTIGNPASPGIAGLDGLGSVGGGNGPLQQLFGNPAALPQYQQRLAMAGLSL